MANSQAFTLIEMITVILLIAILGSIALPKFVNLKEDAALQANQKIFRDFSRQIEQAHILYSIKKGSNAELDWDQDGQTDLKFEFGYPAGARPKGETEFHEFLGWTSPENHLTCSAIFNVLMKTNLELRDADWDCFNAGINLKECFKNPDVDLYVMGNSYPEAKYYQCYYLFSNSLIDKNPDFGDSSTIDGMSFMVNNGLLLIGYTRGIISMMPGVMSGSVFFSSLPNQTEAFLVSGDDFNAVAMEHSKNRQKADDEL